MGGGVWAWVWAQVQDPCSWKRPWVRGLGRATFKHGAEPLLRIWSLGVPPIPLGVHGPPPVPGRCPSFAETWIPYPPHSPSWLPHDFSSYLLIPGYKKFKVFYWKPNLYFNRILTMFLGKSTLPLETKPLSLQSLEYSGWEAKIPQGSMGNDGKKGYSSHLLVIIHLKSCIILLRTQSHNEVSYLMLSAGWHPIFPYCYSAGALAIPLVDFSSILWG